MDAWDDLIDDLWPDGANEEGIALSYIRGRLQRDNLRKAAALRLAPDLGSECAASLQTDWDWHYRFTYALFAPLVFNPEDPAQWFVDMGLNRYPQKARDVLRNIAIVERRHAVMTTLLPDQPAEPIDMSTAALDWIKVQSNPAWELARWVMQIAIGLSESGNGRNISALLRQLPAEHMNLLFRYAAALELVIAAGKQAALEAIERPV